MSKSICIVGAGPSGLTAAKTFLHNAPAGEFKVTVVDAQHDIGGLWPTSKSDSARQVHPRMVANQSKNTVQFSDLSWEKAVPQFPRAWQVGQYLQRYHDLYLKGEEGFELRLNSRVVKASQSHDAWNVEIRRGDATSSERFDKLIVASGFFGKPILPECLSTSPPTVPVIQSCYYRDLPELLSKSKPGGTKILVVGGQMSGVEIAATIATHLSSAVNSPEASDIPDIDAFSVHHIVQRPIWIFPLFSSPEAGATAPPFLPIDFASYNRSNRPAPLTNTQGHIAEEDAARTHGIFQATFGTDQSEFSPHLHIDERTVQQPAYLAVSDHYCDLVRSGLIQLTTGKLEGMDGQTAVVSGGQRIDDVAAVVVATGFDPNPCIDFLPEEALEKMQHSRKHLNHPLALAFHGTHHHDVPGLGFVGFYRSPYWGVMQMQSRFLARLWSDAEVPSAEAEVFSRKLQEDVSIQRTLDLRNDDRSSQFPMGDYQYLMQELAQALSIPIVNPDGLADAPTLPHNDMVLDCLTPARYPHPTDTLDAQQEAETSMSETLDTTLSGLTSTKFVSRAIFRSLLGTWKLERDLTSRLPYHPSGHFSGTARFLLRSKTSDGLSASAAAKEDGTGLEYLYIEEGEFKTEQGFSFTATRRYVWRYDEVTDRISVWFVKPEELKRADYLFHQVEIIQPDRLEAGKRGDGWDAKAGHLCVEDYYDVRYNFKFKAVNLSEWGIEYTVNGPKKDYTIRGRYTR